MCSICAASAVVKAGWAGVTATSTRNRSVITKANIEWSSSSLGPNQRHQQRRGRDGQQPVRNPLPFETDYLGEIAPRPDVPATVPLDERRPPEGQGQDHQEFGHAPHDDAVTH